VSNYYQSKDEIEAVVRGFESCTTPAADFTHCAHLTVAVCYLSHATTLNALVRMRASLFRFLDHHKVDKAKYHETLTVFWLKLVRQEMDGLAANCSVLEAANAVIESLGNSRMVLDYYSDKLLWSDEARQSWVAPDLKPLMPGGQGNVSPKQKPPRV
jgi:hypothetical protein